MHSPEEPPETSASAPRDSTRGHRFPGDREAVKHPQQMRAISMAVVAVPLAVVLAHLAVAALTPYGIFRDELYYIACSKRPAFGYVDQPPLSIWMLGVSRWLLGESLFAIRVIPSLLAGVTIWLTGLIALRMGGGRFAVILAGIAAALAPITFAMHSVYSMNAFDHFFWTLTAFLLLLLLERPTPGRWLLLGGTIGLGALNKISMLWFAAGIAAAVLLNGELRRQLRTSAPWIAAGLAALIFLPYVLWNTGHDFAHLEFMRNAVQYKYGSITRLDFLAGQILILNPAAAPLWLGGLYYLLLNREGKRFRPLAIIYLTVMLVLLVNGHSKPEYPAPAYPLLFAASGVWIERLSRHRYGWLRPVSLTVILLTGLFLLPMAAPILPEKTFVRYSAMIGIDHPNVENKEIAQLPQFFADMHGWEKLAKTVSEVYTALPEEEKADAVVFARNYGEAGAIEYFSNRYPLPRVISVHNNYWIWGYPKHIGTIIFIGGEEESHRASCDSVTAAAVFQCEYCMPYENNKVIWICRGLLRPMAAIWRSEKHFI